MIAIRTEDEIALLREANQMVAEVLAALAARVEPGLPTIELDRLAAGMIAGFGAAASFLGYRGYPNVTCISVDNEVVHGIPGDRRLKAGELVSMDVGVNWQGYHGDAAVTVPCGEVDAARQHLLDATRDALSRAIEAVRAGVPLGVVGEAVQTVCESAGLSVVKCFAGHGIGRNLHEEPQVPNFVTGADGPTLEAGMVLAIEPMVNAGTGRVEILPDGWTAVTADGRPSCHFEHSIVVRSGRAEILSAPAAGASVVW